MQRIDKKSFLAAAMAGLLAVLYSGSPVFSSEPNSGDSSPSQTPNKQQAELAQLLEDAWEFGMVESPTWATRVGDHRFNDKLSSVSLADSKRRNEAEKNFLKRLEAIDREKLPRADQVNYDIYRRSLNDGLRGFEFGSYGNL